MAGSRRRSKTGWNRSLHCCLVAGVSAFAANTAFAAEYYVSPTGNDSNPGSQASPFASLSKAASTAAAGDTVYIRGGTYQPAGGITFSSSGTSDTNRINYWAYPGEVPVFDFSKASGGSSMFNVDGSWLHFKGLEVCNSPSTPPMSGISINNANHDIMELMNIHHAQGTGIFIYHGSGGHLLLNCDAHDNYDPSSSQGDGQNADGFGVHYQAPGDGTSTMIKGCRAWWNSDDGYDFINQEFPVTIEDSWAFGNGYTYYGTSKPGAGNGNGFKIGSSKTGIRHLVQNNVAWGNRAAGFYANHSSGGNTWYNNTSFQNGTQFDMLASTWSEPNGGGTRTDGVILTGAKAHIMRNNIAFPNKNSFIDGYGVNSQFNTWDLNITPAAKDFLSTTDSTIGGTGQVIETTSVALGPRQADGSVPNGAFLRLAAGSAMIDKGTDVKLPLVGGAADLGAFEFGAAGGSGSGGTPGTGGAAGAGGRAGGATGSGGSPGVGGASGRGGVAASSDGGPATGGTGAAGSGGEVGTGDAAVGTGETSGASPAGCSCRLAEVETASDPGFAWLGLLIVLPRLRKRRSQPKTVRAPTHLV